MTTSPRTPKVQAFSSIQIEKPDELQTFLCNQVLVKLLSRFMM